MGRSRNIRAGFTLIELMITVVILGVLSAVALLSYNVYVKRARTAEATGLLSNIKANQETYRSEFGLYANVATPYPAAPPSSTGEIWDPPTAPAKWRSLGFVPDKPRIYFQLDTISGGPGVACGWVFAKPMAADLTNDFWFVAKAEGNQDGDGIRSTFWITSKTTAVDYSRPLE